jgi:hypothetical protein
LLWFLLIFNIYYWKHNTPSTLLRCLNIT